MAINLVETLETYKGISRFGNVYFTLYKKKIGWGLSEPFQGMGWGQGHIVKIILAHRGNSTLITGMEGETMITY